MRADGGDAPHLRHARVANIGYGRCVTVTRNRLKNPFGLRRLRVSGVHTLTPQIVRITLTGDMSDFVSHGPTDHVKVFFPGEDGIVHAPRVEEGRLVRDPGVEYISRDYTPLNWTDSTLDLDVVLHGDSGPAANWAANAHEGDELVVGGPRGSKQVPTGADWWLLIADASAVPALGRWLAQAPADQEVSALVFGEESLTDYPLPPEADVEWVLGDFDPEPYARERNLTEGTGFVWAAGEATSLIGIRRYLRRELALPKEQVEVDGYWRRGTSDADHHAPIDPADPED